MSEMRCFSITTDKRLGITVNPYPINEEDVLDCDGEIPEQFEESLDDHKKLEDSYSLCNAHNALSNVSRFKEIIETTGWNQTVSDGNESLQNTMESNNLRGVDKAHVPISKFRNALDDKDREDQMGFRCAKCLTCKTSNRKTAISLQEAREQQFIEESVIVDTKLRRVMVNYPFLKDPVEYLSGVHKNPNNYGQAVKVYKTQCRKSDVVKEGMRKVHADLVEKGFMMKMDSMTTPVRMVVDPPMTRFNEILAKGESRIGLIFTIMIRCSCMEYIWSSDISKLYNQLILDDPPLLYSLFLYDTALDPEKEPDVWVMVRAWYGIVSTGGQAGFALDRLMEMMAEEFPEAYKTLRENQYVDALLSGAKNEETRERQISVVQEVLLRGGFNLKFIDQSGDKPSEKASSDGERMKLLGYKWDL